MHRSRRTMTAMTTTTPSNNKFTPLKNDTLGRITTPPQQREALLDLFEQGDLSAAAFARFHGLRYSTFAGWSLKRRRERNPISDLEPPPPPKPRLPSLCFQEVLLEADTPADQGLLIELPAGAQMRVHHPTQVPLAAQLIQQLQETHHA